MKKLLLFTFILLYTFKLNSQKIESPYQTGTWKDFAKAAITYTFDDWCANQKTIALPLLNEYDFDATFFPVINWQPDWEALQLAVANGHEVGSHTVSHAKLGSISDEQQINELYNSLTVINKKIPGQNCQVIAYPNCILGKQSICDDYYIAGRHCHGNIEATTPLDFYSISSIVCGNKGPVKTGDDFKKTDDAAATANGWCVYLIHGIDNDGGYSELSSSVLMSGLEYLNNNRDKFWVSTFGNVVKYIRERNSVSLSVVANKTDTIELLITDTLDNSVYNSPLTFRRPLPEKWMNATVMQNGKPVEYKKTTLNSIQYIEFNAIPDKGVVRIVKSKQIMGTDTNHQKQNTLKFSSNPFNDYMEIAVKGAFDYQILTVGGETVENGKSKNRAVVGKSLKAGTYFLKITNKLGLFTKMIIKS